MPLTCQWQMSEAKERRRLFEDETGRNFGQHADETSLSFESFAERRRRERFLEPQQYQNLRPKGIKSALSSTYYESIATQVNGEYMRLPIDLEKPSRSYRKVFIRNSNNTHWIGNLMTVEITTGELARNGKIASCWF